MPQKEEFHRFSISLPKSLFEEFEVFREQHNITRSDAIRKAMRDYISHKTRELSLLSDEKTSAVIVLSLEHVWEGPDHDHEKLSTDSHSTHHSLSDPAEILDLDYFNYPDSDLLKINHLEHVYHDIVLSKLHIHSAHDRCILMIPVKGSGVRIAELYNYIMQLKSVLSHDLIIEG